MQRRRPGILEVQLYLNTKCGFFLECSLLLITFYVYLPLYNLYTCLKFISLSRSIGFM